MANCYRLKNGTYSIRVSNGKPNGKQKFVSTTYKPPEGLDIRKADKAAKEFAELFEKMVRSGMYIPNRKKKANENIEIGITLQNFVEQYYYKKVEYRFSPNTFVFYRSVIEQFILPSFGKLRIVDISSKHLQAFVDYLSAPGARFDESNSKPLSPATIKRYATVFSSVMNEAFKMGLAEKDVLHKEYVAYPKIYKQSLQAYDREEVKIFFEALEREHPKIRAMLYTSLLLGLRRGEVVGLMWSDFDFKKNCLYVTRSAYKTAGEKQSVKMPKSKSSVRTVFYSDEYAEALKLWYQQQQKDREMAKDDWNEQGFVFTNDKGEMMSIYALTRICSEHEKKCGLRHLKLHGLRHTCGSLMIQSGVDIETVRSMFGHESIRTTQQYLSSYEKSKKRAADLLIRQLTDRDED